MVNTRKKGQAGAAATLIAIIAALIVIYILVIPPAERQKILEGDDGTIEGIESILFDLDNPKSFLEKSDRSLEKNLPNVNLFLYQEGSLLKSLDSLYASRSLFSESKGTMTFKLDDLENTENLLLNFITTQRKGRLSISLNGVQIFNKELTTSNIAPIKLKDNLKSGTNILEFSVSSPGVKFWRNNVYSLADISITADVTRKEAQDATVSFVITSSEKSNMEKSKLRFIPNCDVGKVGNLDVWLNNRNLFSGVPDCNSPIFPIEFSPDYLSIGENTLKFRTIKGRYLLDQIRITSQLEGAELPIYYFQLTDDQYDEVSKQTSKVEIKMRFTDSEDLKEADVAVNGNLMLISQREIEYTKDISNLVKKGNNALKIEPIKTLDVAELQVIFID